jgi:hypothetical protein
MRPQVTANQFYIDADTINGDGSLQNPLTATGTSGGTVDAQNLVISPTQPEPYGPGANMPAGYVANWTQPGLATHTNLEWRGADNQGTVLTGIDATGIPEGAVRIFNNATLSPGDAGSVVLVDEGDARATAGPWMSLADNRICTPGQMDYRVHKQDVCVMQRRRNANGDIRWVVLSGSARKLWLWVQQLALYPHNTIGSNAAPIAGVVNNWNPVGRPFGGNPEGLTVDGGNANDSRTFTFWNVFADAGGLRVTGLEHSPLNGLPTDWGVLRFIFNSGPGPITFGHLDGGSNVECQLRLPNDRDYVLPVNCGAWFITPYLDESIGVTVQWRMMGVSNEVFPSVNTDGRTTTRQVTLRPPSTPVALAAVPAITSDWQPDPANPLGPSTVIKVSADLNGSVLDGIVPFAPLVPGEVYTLLNVGGRLAIQNESASASAVNNRFTLPGGSPIMLPGQGSLLIRYDESSKWCCVDSRQVRSWDFVSILPAVLPAANVNDYAPTDAASGWPGRYAKFWRLQGAVGTNLTGIGPGAFQAYQDGDEIELENAASGLTIVHNSGLSALGNRFSCPGAANFVFANGMIIVIRYNQPNQVWQFVSVRA